MAVAIAANSLWLIQEKKYIKAVLAIGASTLFHPITLLLLFPVGISLLKNKKTIRNLLIAFNIIVLIGGRYLQLFLLQETGNFYYIQDEFLRYRFISMTTILTLSGTYM